MATVTAVTDAIGLSRRRWVRGPVPFWQPVFVASAASLLLAFSRFGGLLIDAPRAFVRMALVGIYGWLGLAFAVWAALRLTQSSVPNLRRTIELAGLAHLPLLAFGVIMFFSANLLQLLGPGLVMAILVVGFWMPALLIAGTHHVHQVTVLRSTAVVALPYFVWALVIARHLLAQVRHLL